MLASGAARGSREHPGRARRALRPLLVPLAVFGLVSLVYAAGGFGALTAGAPPDVALGRAGFVALSLLLTLLISVLLGPGLLAGRWWVAIGKLSLHALVLTVVALAAQRLTGATIEIGPALVTLAGCFIVGRFGHFSHEPREQEADSGVEVPEAVFSLDESGCVERLNHAAREVFHLDERDAVGCHLGELFGLKPTDAAHAEMESLIERGFGVCELNLTRKNGQSFPAQLGVSAVVSGDQRHTMIFARDISEDHARQRTLEHQATHDALTNLPNRYLLRDRIPEVLAAAAESGACVSFLLLDLDRFKEINDTLGHHTGDLLLQRIARRLSGGLRPGDTVARLGGDEFAVLLPATDTEKAREVANRLCEAIERPFRIDGLTLHVDTAVGIAMFPEHGREPGSLLQRADVAMYLAKRAGARVAVYNPSRDLPNVRQLSLSSELRGAIEQGQLTLHYQPKIEVMTDRIVAVEALVRWEHPDHGCIPPDEFIGLAEQTGLIHPLTDWVLRAALAQCAEWTRDGLHLGVSVNISARNLLNEEMPQDIRRLLVQTRVPPHLLTLEITESAIMENPQRALEVIVALSDLGLSISIDDFGTGYSSLGYLKNLPCNEIKIDKSFVMEMDHNEEDATIVRSTIDLAHNLGLRVVAEGVETEPVWRALKRLGCDLGQGYLFSRPLPPEGFLGWLDASVGTTRSPVEAPVVAKPPVTP